MRIPWDTKKQSKLLMAYLDAGSPRNISICVGDWYKPDTCYYYQETGIAGKEDFEISLPVTPDKAFFELLDLDSPLMDVSSSIGLTLEEKPFSSKWNCSFNQNPLIQEFLRFVSWFAENKNILSAAYGDQSRSIYRSFNNNFEIRYVPYIVDTDEFVMGEGGVPVPNPNYGGLSPTSFRIDAYTKVMEASQAYVVDYTITDVFVLLCHEFCHGWINKNPESEEEADMNAITMCRCLGFSKNQIGNGLAKVYSRYPSDQNANRMKLVLEQLKNMP